MRLLPICVLLSILYGCSTPEVTGKRYFWPPPPNTPKIEFVHIYANNLDFPRKSGLLEKVTGTEEVRSFKKPVGIASDGKGLVYVTDPNQASVIVYNLNEYTVETLGEPGLFQTPVGVAVDRSGSVYVSDSSKNKIFVLSRDGSPLFHIAGEHLNWPTGIAIDDERGRLYVANSHSHDISVFDKRGNYMKTIGARGRGDGKFNFPVGVAVNSKGRLLVADSMNAVIQIFSPDGDFIKQFGQRGDSPMDFEVIKGVSADSEDNIYVIDSKANKLLVFNENGDPLTFFNGRFYVPPGAKGPLHGGLALPSGIAVDKNNTIFVTDTWNKRFQVYQYLSENYLKLNPEINLARTVQ